MINVTKIGDLAFEVRFDERVRRDLQEFAGWGAVEDALGRVLSDIILGSAPHSPIFDDLDDDVPF
jgi:hypothetical protein